MHISYIALTQDVHRVGVLTKDSAVYISLQHLELHCVEAARNHTVCSCSSKSVCSGFLQLCREQVLYVCAVSSSDYFRALVYIGFSKQMRAYSCDASGTDVVIVFFKG